MDLVTSGSEATASTYPEEVAKAGVINVLRRRNRSKLDSLGGGD